MPINRFAPRYLPLLVVALAALVSCGRDIRRPGAESPRRPGIADDSDSFVDDDRAALALTWGNLASPGPERQEFVAANNSFALNLFTCAAAEGRNVVVSPYCVYRAMAMVYAGARGNTMAELFPVFHFSETTEQMSADFLALEETLRASNSSPGGELTLASKLWADANCNFSRTYSNFVDHTFGSEPGILDFANAPGAASRAIDQWLQENTRGTIRNLRRNGAIDSSSRLALACTVYFRGRWLDPFFEPLTQTRPFFLGTQGNTVDVPTMKNKASYQYFEDQQVQVLLLPYASREDVESDYSMVILLPKQRGLTELKHRLTPHRLHRWISRTTTTRVTVFLPRFAISDTRSVRSLFQRMGVRELFSAESADLSGMGQSRGVYLADIAHAVSVNVDENGTEASAATLVVGGAADVGPPATFVADHPFLFIIRHHGTGTILFIGQVGDPTQSGV